MTQRRSTSTLSFRPCLQGLEARDVPAQLNLADLAAMPAREQAINDTIHFIADNAQTIVNNPQLTQEAENYLKSAAGTVGADEQELVDAYNQETTAVQNIDAGLEQSLATATSQTIEDYNQQVLALDREVAGLSPAQQQLVAGAVSEQKIQLADGAIASISRFRDIVGGEERAVAFLYEESGRAIGITLGRAKENEALLTQAGFPVNGNPIINPPPPGTLRGTYQGTVALTNGQLFSSAVTGQGFTVTSSSISGTVVFAQYPVVQNNVVVSTQPNIPATVSGTITGQQASGTFTIHLGSQGDAQLTFTGTVTSSTITLELTNPADGSSAGTITINR